MSRSRPPAAPLTVLYSFPHAIGASGIGWTAWNQVTELVAAGHRVHLVAASITRQIEGLASMRTSLEYGLLRVRPRAVGRDRAYVWHDRVAANVISRVRPDVTHAWPLSARRSFLAARGVGSASLREVPNTHTGHAFEVVAEEARRIGVVTPRGTSHAFNPVHYAIEEMEWAAATALLVPSDAVARTFLARGFDSRRLLRHQYGYRPANGAVARERTPADPFTAIFIGRGEPRKGLHYALEAWRRSVAGRQGRFIIYGDFQAEYRNHLGPLLAQPSVEVRGFTWDAVGVMAAADVLLLPTIEEGSALVTYEAQAAGCVPLVSTAAGARIVDGESGLLHEPRDVATLVAQLDRLVEQPAELARLRAGALRRAPELTWAAANTKLVAAYREAMRLAEKDALGASIE